LISFLLEKLLFLYVVVTFMAGVFAHMGWLFSRRPGVQRQVYCQERPDRRAIELETAKEILREVFGTTPVDVDEMIRLRLVQRSLPGRQCL
jgi:hypothetical protein